MGRGIAEVLGEAGATVYVTGRSTEAHGPIESVPGSVEETARSVSTRGVRGIAVQCDHTVDRDVEALFERVRREQRRGTQSPHYCGRAVVSLASDPNVMAKSGQALSVSDLAREYGFTDTDGTQP